MIRRLEKEIERAPAEDRETLRGSAIETLVATENAPTRVADVGARRRRARLSPAGVVLLLAFGGVGLVPIVPPVGVTLLLLAGLVALGAVGASLVRFATRGLRHHGDTSDVRP